MKENLSTPWRGDAKRVAYTNIWDINGITLIKPITGGVFLNKIIKKLKGPFIGFAIYLPFLSFVKNEMYSNNLACTD